MLMKAQQIRHIVWDWNGTLLDDSAACVAALNRMLEKRRLPPVDLRQYQEAFGFPVKSYYLTLGFDFTRDNWDDVAREYHDFYAITSASSPLRAGAVDLLHRLRDRGMPMSILSACEQAILEQMLAARGIRHLFEHIRGLSNLFATSKVDIGRALLADITLPPEQVLLIGDTLHDHEVARDLGCECLLVAGGHQAEHRLAGCSCDVVPDLRDVFT
jgi:phosphoglycolate phosphatase